MTVDAGYGVAAGEGGGGGEHLQNVFLGVDLAACESDAGGDGVGDALRESVEAGQRRLNLGGGKPGKRGDGLTQTLVAAVECAPGSRASA